MLYKNKMKKRKKLEFHFKTYLTCRNAQELQNKNFKIQKMVKNLNPYTYFYIKDTFIFYITQDKSRKLKQKNHFKNNLNTYTYTKIKN